MIYSTDEKFTIGGLKVLRESAGDVVTVVAAGVTVFEALKAYDAAEGGGTARFASSISIRSRRSIGNALVAAGARDRWPHHHGRGSLRGRRDRRRGRRGGRRRPAFACIASRSARFRAAASRRSCSIATAFRRGTSSRWSGGWREAKSA